MILFTPQQREAIEHHVRLASECVNPRFRTVNRRNGLSVIVTVNSGYE
jgi:hypothetical protein